MVDHQARRGGAPRSPSMAEVAARAGVSHQTVSPCLNDASLVKEETRLRVLAAIEELGYRRNYAARLLATNRSRRIGMVSAHLALYGPSMIATAVQEAGQAEGYDVSLVGLHGVLARRARRRGRPAERPGGRGDRRRRRPPRGGRDDALAPSCRSRS